MTMLGTEGGDDGDIDGVVSEGRGGDSIVSPFPAVDQI